MKRKFVLLTLLIFYSQVLLSKENPQIKGINENQETRSIVTETALGQNVKAAAFLDRNKFYVATEANEDKSLARVVMSRSQDEGSEGTWKVEFNAMAPQSGVIINKLSNQDGPLFGQTLSHLALGGYTDSKQYPITGLVVPGEEEAEEEAEKLASEKDKVLIFQILDLYEGNAVLKNADATAPDTTEYSLKDTGGADNAKGLHAIAATKAAKEKNLIFALTSDNAELKSATLTKIGISPIQVNESYLNPLDATNFNNSEANNKSIGILDALKILGNPSFTENEASADMIWDDKLNTLYLALSNVKTNKTANNGAVALLIGQISDNKMEVNKITTADLTAGDKTAIIGYKNGTEKTTFEQIINLYKVRVMHTSTGKDYLIVNGEVVQNSDSNSTGNVVYALPLASDGTLENLVNDGEMQAKVGKNFNYLVHSNKNEALADAAIKDIQVLGDTLYIAVAGSREAISDEGKSGEAGIFESTAIFSETGAIRAWTPWQRVMGSTDKAHNIGFDKNSSNYWYIGAKEDDPQKATITLWSAGDTSDSGIHGGKPLSTALQPYFTQDILGVVGLFNFDDETPGFKSWNPASAYPSFSMMIATGYGIIALIQTGKRDDNGIFTPTKEFIAKKISEADETTNVFIFDTTITQALGFITCAEISRIQTYKLSETNPKVADGPQECGWIFIGGENGIAVLRKNDGTGWNTTDGLSALNSTSFPGTAYSFLKLQPPSGFNFKNIRKLVSDGKYLYILTRTDLYRLEMNADDFTSSSTISTDRLKHLASINNLFKDKSTDTEVMNPNFDEFFDLLVVDKTSDASILLIGTTQGVWISDAIVNPSSISWNELENYLGPTLMFNFISTLRGGQFNTDKADGNLYITAIDSTYEHINVYRFDIQAGSVTKFTEPYQVTSTTGKTDYFYKIADLNDYFKGLEFAGQLDHVANKYQVTENLPLTPNPDKFLPTTESGVNYYKSIDLKLDPNAALHLMSVVRDTASGAPYIPGEFTVFVNE